MANLRKMFGGEFLPHECRANPAIQGLMMKTTTLATALVLAATAVPALGADLLYKKAAPPPAPAPSMFDIALGTAIATDYNFRGISQSDRGPSVSGYFEPRFKIAPNFEIYAGIGGLSVKLPTDPTAEIDLYAGIRPTFGPVNFDFGVLYYYYPNETQLFCVAACPSAGTTGVTPFPWTKANTDFWEVYGKAAYTFADVVTLGANVYHSPNWLNTGATGTYGSLTGKVTVPTSWMPPDIGAYVSAELGRYWLGTTDAFFGNTPLPDYTYWNVGLGLTYKALTLDLRYHDTDLNRAQCFVLTGDPGGLPAGPGQSLSRWCSEAFIAKLSVDTTLAALK